MKSKNKLSRWVLLIGILIWIIGLASGFIFSVTDTQISGQDNLVGSMKFLFKAFPIIMIVFLCVIQPIFEEIAFRFWGIEKKYAYILSLVGIGFFTLTVFFNIIFSLISIGICVYLMFFLKNEKLKNILLLSFTSILFTTVHITGFSNFSWATILQLFQILGLSVVSCYLVLNYKFIYGCGLHIFNNLIGICLPLILTPTIDTFSTNEYDAEISAVSIFEKNNRSTVSWAWEIDDPITNTISFYGELPEIAYRLTPHDWNIVPNTMYVAKPDNSTFWSEYKYVIHYKDSTYEKNNSLIYNLLKHSNLKADTTYEFAYVVDICDIDKFNKKDSGNKFKQPLSHLINSLRETYEIPFILENGINESASIYTGNDLFDFYEKSQEEEIDIFKSGNYEKLFDYRIPPEKLFDIMEHEYGLKVTKSINTKIQVITFFVK